MVWVFVSTSCWREVEKNVKAAVSTETVENTEWEGMEALIAKQYDNAFYAKILAQSWSPKYIKHAAEFKGPPQDLLLSFYHLMAASFKEMQSKKQQDSQRLREQMRSLNVKSTGNVTEEKREEKVERNGVSGHSVSGRGGGTALSSKETVSGQSQSGQSRSGQSQSGHSESAQSSLWSFDYAATPLLAALLTRNEEQIPDKVIWQFWHQTEEAMPVNVRFCIESVRWCNPKWKHILISPKNIWRYLDPKDLPPNVLSFDKMAHLSDVVRVAVLARYGGI